MMVATKTSDQTRQSVCVFMFIELHIPAQPDPVVLSVEPTVVSDIFCVAHTPASIVGVGKEERLFF